MIGAGTEAGIVIQAVRALGKKRVHEIPAMPSQNSFRVPSREPLNG